MFLVELLDQRLHAHAVAAAQEIPPDDRFLCLRGGSECNQRRRRERFRQSISHQFLPVPVFPYISGCDLERPESSRGPHGTRCGLKLSLSLIWILVGQTPAERKCT